LILENCVVLANPPASGDRDPRWRPEQQFTALELPSAGRRWLLDNDSLTARLIALDAGAFSVRRLYQGWQAPLPSEQTLLQVPPRQRALVREVVLRLDEHNVVFARSVFPISSLSGELAHLRKLQNRSLGAILFRYPGMQRSPFELARIAGNSAYMAPWIRQQEDAWARRSCFDISGKRLLVSEVFLQGFTPWNAMLPVHRSQRGKVSAAITGVKQ
jgi:chorismate--pyruvate lyase